MKNARIAGFILWVAVAQAASAATTISSYQIDRPEGKRSYMVAQPEQGGGRLPTIILLHGHGATGAWMLGQDSFAGFKTRSWIDLAEREHVLLIAPQGVKASDGKYAWNDCRADASTNTDTDDVAFVSSLIDKAVAEHHADPKRIYVYGSSNGGGMAYRLAIELGPRLAAIGVQSSLMAAASECRPATHALPVFLTHGTADEVAPYAGGKVEHWALRGRGTGLSVDESVAFWRKLAKLPEQPVTYKFPVRHPGDQTSATRIVWGADSTGLQVELLRIDGGGHTQSSTTEEMPWLLRKLVGWSSRDVDTSEEVWTFFKDKRAR